MSSCISTIGRICLMNFSIRDYSSCPIIGESRNICFHTHVHGQFCYRLLVHIVSYSCPWAVLLSFVGSIV